jgi:hypothetical protein
VHATSTPFEQFLFLNAKKRECRLVGENVNAKVVIDESDFHNGIVWLAELCQLTDYVSDLINLDFFNGLIRRQRNLIIEKKPRFQLDSSEEK